MDKSMKTTQIDILSPCNRLIGVQIVPLENLSGVVQGMQDRALPGTVGTEQQRDGAKVEGTGSRMPLKFSIVMPVIMLDWVSRTEVVDHFPKAIGFSPVDHFNRLQAVEGFIWNLQPCA